MLEYFILKQLIECQITFINYVFYIDKFFIFILSIETLITFFILTNKIKIM